MPGDERNTVSVVIPTYNRSGELEDCLKSVQSQTRPVLEIIVVDDCSTDNTRNLLEEISAKDARIKLVSLSRNGGVSAARNAGIAAARGKFIAFLDSDDRWLPDKIRVQMERIESFVSTQVFSFGATRVLGDGGSIRVRPSRPPREGEHLGDFLYLEDQFVQTSSFLVSSDLANEVLFSLGLKRFEDHLFALQAEAKGATVVYVEEALVEWRDDHRPGRLSLAVEEVAVDRYITLAGAMLSERAASALAAKEVIPLLLVADPARGVRMMYAALTNGALSYSQLSRIILRGLLPLKLYRELRAITLRALNRAENQ